MRLLIVTQTVNTDDPVLGFFHHWIEVFAKEFEHIHVICLSEGKHVLPKNVTIHSLGKEHGGNRFLYTFRFLKLAYGLGKEYDAVFVHMNPEYVFLAGDFWRLTKKKVGLWYNHDVGSFWLQVAAPFVDVLFHTSPYAFTARYKHARLMPAGIDTELFKPTGSARAQHSIYFQGRVSRAKRVHVLLEAVRSLRASLPVTVTIAGPEDEAYGKKLRNDYKDLIDSQVVVFLGSRRNEETPQLYSSHAVSVNLTANGNFDKSVLESMACETPVLVSSLAFSDLVPVEWVVREQDATHLTEMLRLFFSKSHEQIQALGVQERSEVVRRHSLASLATRLVQEFS